MRVTGGVPAAHGQDGKGRLGGDGLVATSWERLGGSSLAALAAAKRVWLGKAVARSIILATSG